jgi:hypothetical protein
MTITPEQNEQIVQMRNELTNMLTKLNHLAVTLGATPLEGEEESPPLTYIHRNIEPPVFIDAPGVINGVLQSDPEGSKMPTDAATREKFGQPKFPYVPPTPK